MKEWIHDMLYGEILRKSIDFVLEMEEDIVALSLFELKDEKGENDGKEHQSDPGHDPRKPHPNGGF